MIRKQISDEDIRIAVENAESFAGVIRLLGLKLAGGTQSHYKRRIEKLGLDISHFTGKSHGKGKKSTKRLSCDSILVLRVDGYRQKAMLLKRALIEVGVPYICNLCGQLPEWRGNPLTLDVDHINCNWLDDRRENLRFLCPNCHSQLSRGLCTAEGN